MPGLLLLWNEPTVVTAWLLTWLRRLLRLLHQAAACRRSAHRP